MTKRPMNPTPSPTLETPETDRLVGSNSTERSAESISPGYLAESRRSRRSDESRPKLDENARRDARETLPTLDDSRPRNDADAEVRHLRARVRSGIREYARGVEWVRDPAHGDLRVDHRPAPGELLLTLEEARVPDAESDAVMRADARALSEARDLETAIAAQTNRAAIRMADTPIDRLIDRCRVRLARALDAADRAAAPKGAP